MKRKPRNNSFFIVVNPVGSKFAKALQSALRDKTTANVLRTNRVREGRSFIVTTNPLNKIEQFTRFSGRVSSPKFARSIQDAKALECRTLFARTIVNGTNGRGIIEFNQDDAQYPVAPLYTEYIPKKAEYRVHVFNGEVIDIQQKKKSRSFNNELRDTRVRNTNNGYVYCRDGIDPPDGIAPLALSAVAACGYQYGAVDIIFNEKRNQCYVLEVNSRPGLMGTTLDKYSDAIIKTFNLERK